MLCERVGRLARPFGLRLISSPRQLSDVGCIGRLDEVERSACCRRGLKLVGEAKLLGHAYSDTGEPFANLLLLARAIKDGEKREAGWVGRLVELHQDVPDKQCGGPILAPLNLGGNAPRERH